MRVGVGKHARLCTPGLHRRSEPLGPLSQLRLARFPHGSLEAPWAKPKKRMHLFTQLMRFIFSGLGIVVLMPHGAFHGRGGMRVVPLLLCPHGDSI